MLFVYFLKKLCSSLEIPEKKIRDALLLGAHDTKRKATVLLWDNSSSFRQSVDAIVRFTHTTDRAADSIGLEGAGHSAGGLIDISDVDLDGGVILGSNDAIARRAESKQTISVNIRAIELFYNEKSISYHCLSNQEIF